MLGTCHYLMLPFLRQLLFDYVHLMDVVWKSLSDTLNMSWAGPWEVGGFPHALPLLGLKGSFKL